MSTATRTPRLLAAAKEFNIGKETLVEYLTNKGFEINASNPNTKLTEEMYDALQGEFAQDKLAKRKSEEIALPKGSLLDAKKKKEEAAPPVAKKTEEPAPKKEEKPEPVAKPKEVKAEEPNEKEAEPQAQPEPEKEEPKKAAKKKEEIQEEVAPEAETSEHIEVKTPKLGGPNVLG